MANDARFKQQIANAIAKNRIRILSGSSTTYHSASFLTAESGSVVNLYSPILIPAATASSFPTPNEGTGSLYVSAVDYKLYFQDSYGSEYDLTIGSTPGGELTASNIMIDGSTSGSINFVNDGVIYIKDNDATALQIQEATNAYMTFDTTNSSEKVVISKDLQLVSTDAGAGTAPILDFFRDSSSPDVDDLMGRIRFTGKDDAGNTTLYASITAEINDETNSGGQEDGVLTFKVIKNASQKSVLELKNNEAVFNNAGADIDFRIESDDETHMFFIDGNENRVSIGDSTDTPTATLEVTNHASAGATGAPLVQLNSNDVDQIALDINAANTTENVIHVVADALTTGRAALFESNSSDNSVRSLVKIHNNNASATHTQPLTVQQDAPSATIAQFNKDNAETVYGAIIVLNRMSTTVADDMGVGLINFEGLTDGGTNTGFARITAEATDVSDATPRGKLIFRAQQGHTTVEPEAVEEMMHIGGGDTATGVAPAVVINDQNYDNDFRVASSASTHAFFVDGGSDFVRMDAAQGLHLKDLGGHANTPASGYGVIYVNGDVPYFKTDGGTATSMIGGGGGGSPGGSDTQIQYNNGGSFGGVASMTFDDSSGHLTIIDDKRLRFGTGNDASFEYDEDGTDTLLYNGASLRISDDVKIEFGTGGDSHIEYDENGSDFMIVSGSGNGIAMSGSNIVMKSRTQAGLLLTSATHTLANITPSAGALSGQTPRLMFAGTNEAPLVSLYARDGDDNCDTLILSSSYSQVIFGEKASDNSFKVGKETDEVIFKVDSTGVVINEGSKAANDFRVESDGEDEAIFLDSSENALYVNKGETAFTTQIHSTNDVAMTVGAAGVIFNEDGHATNDFRVESDNGTHMLFVDSGNNRVSIGNSTDDPGAVLEVVSAANSGVPLILLDNDDTDKICLDIDAANIDADVIDIAADAVTTAFVMDVTADALTTGGILNLVSDSSDTSARTLVTVKNDNTAAVGTVVMHLVNDAIGGSDDPILLIESTANETHPVLELKNSNASTTGEPILLFHRSDTSAEADDMKLGQIQFKGVDSGNNSTFYAQIKADATDVTSGDEGGEIKFILMAGGTAGTAGIKELLTIGGEDVANSTPCAVIVNESGIDCDFRVESDNNTHMLFIDAADDTVTVGADDSLHKDGFAVINDYQGTTFENTLADGQFGSAEILKYSPGADDTLTAGQIYYLHTDGTWNQARCDAVANGASQMLGIGLGGSARTVGCLIKGFIRIPSTEILNVPGSGAVDGLPVYIGPTTGHLDFTAPSSQSQFVRILGYAIDDDSGDVLIYFNPDSTHVEIA